MPPIEISPDPTSGQTRFTETVDLDSSLAGTPQNPGAPPSSIYHELSLFSKLSIITLLFNLAVVAWGVFVRASKSGDGCGSHWPLCDGASTPLNGPIARIIEMSHRLSTGIAGILVLGLLVTAYRWFPRGAQVRKVATFAFGMMMLEGGIGAALVKFQLVTTNPSAFRAEVMSFHVVSTFLLVGSIALCAILGSGNIRLDLRRQGSVGLAIAFGFLATIILGVSGAISALGHTLDPVKDVLTAAAKPGTFWMVRVQPYHPYLSIAIGLYMLLLVALVRNLRPSPLVRKAAIWLTVAYGVELAIGLVNIQLMAPYALQMMHLVAADVIIVSLVAFSAAALTAGVRKVEQEEEETVSPKGMDLVRQYIWLTKPRIISLLLVTTITAAFAGAGGWPGLTVLLALSVGGYLMAGAANALNMVLEQDLDRAMARTSGRPTVTHKISTSKALGFALTVMMISFTILTLACNLLTAVLAMGGLVFYIAVYTLTLKRRTWNNIVIGGAAGAFPPLVGWAAVHNELAPLAWFLFGIVFLWTPVHFWALAILIKDDYAAAGVPMLPVVKGDRVTSIHIAVYTALTVICSLIPLAVRLVGWPYLVAALALNGILIWLTVKLVQRPERTQAKGLFHYSMLYLALLFLAVAIDRAMPARFEGTGVKSASSVEGTSGKLVDTAGFSESFLRNDGIFMLDRRGRTGIASKASVGFVQDGRQSANLG